jgi:acetyl-CoA carboxylase biotin carboxyl carrier protein
MTDGPDAREAMPPEASATGLPAQGAMDPDGAILDPAIPDVEEPTDPGDIALLGLIDRLAGLLDRSELTELEVQVGGTGLVLRKPAAVAPPVAVAAAATSGGPGPATGEPGSVAAAPSRPSVKAPLTGIWYGSPSPGTAPYVTVGGDVVAGQVIGLIEAMKLFNEIKSDLTGRVVRVQAEDGKLVKARQPLIEVDPL